MNYAILTYALVGAFGALTTHTIFHLGPVGILLAKIGYNVLAATFWFGFFCLLRQYWRAEHEKVSGFFAFTWRWIIAIILAAQLFVLTLHAKLLAYGPYWSTPDRPMFAFGWPFPWKWESAGGAQHFMWSLLLNFYCCLGLALFLLGFRRLKHFLIAFLLPPLFFAIYVVADGGVAEIYDNLTRPHNTPTIQRSSTNEHAR